MYHLNGIIFPVFKILSFDRASTTEIRHRSAHAGGNVSEYQVFRKFHKSRPHEGFHTNFSFKNPKYQITQTKGRLLPAFSHSRVPKYLVQ